MHFSTSKYYRTVPVGISLDCRRPAKKRFKRQRQATNPIPLSSPPKPDPSRTKTIEQGAPLTTPRSDLPQAKTVEQRMPQAAPQHQRGKQVVVIHQKELAKLRKYNKVAIVCGGPRTVSEAKKVLGEKVVFITKHYSLAPGARAYPSDAESILGLLYDLWMPFDVAAIVGTSERSRETFEDGVRVSRLVIHSSDGAYLI